ncbi:MAG: DNA polymerase III subunit delta' [Deltaproteobacteria bacterium]|nr:DNA polymerase III subunit delta' [Deltaproteobacteria bacterium]
MPFCDIYGQGRQIDVLQSAMKRERVPHAYLFHGIQGIGKKTTAQAFAQALNCRENNADFCGRCPSCLKAGRRSHPDIVMIEPEGIFIKIDKIRDLQNQTQFRPLEGRKKVFILADADRMNDASANALLKTLEEPSSFNILILTTSRIHKLPQTIISRCQQVRFQPLRAEVVASFLIDTLSMDVQVSRAVAASAGGSIGRALDIRKESLLDFKQEVTGVLSAAARVPLDMIFLADTFGKDRDSAVQRLDIFREWYRDMLVYRELHDVGRLTHQDIAEATKEFSEKMTGADILNNIKTIRHAQGAIEQNANRQLILESMTFQLKTFHQV